MHGPYLAQLVTTNLTKVKLLAFNVPQTTCAPIQKETKLLAQVLHLVLVVALLRVI